MHIPGGFSLRRKLPTSSKVFLTLAAACAVASFLLVRGGAARAGGAVGASGPTVGVVVATRDLPAGGSLSADDLRVVQMPVAFAPPSAISSVDDAVGLVSGAAIAQDEPLSRARVGRSALAGSIAPGRLVVSATFGSIPDGLTTWDRVDAFATFGGARPYTALVGEDLRVLRIQAPTSSFGGDRGTIVTLDVDATAARQILQADATGTLALVARSSDTGATASPSPSLGATPAPG
jgi:Flp pilus assembly protein CpaB